MSNTSNTDVVALSSDAAVDVISNGSLDWNIIIVSAIEHLPFPLILALVIIFFRTEIQTLIGRLKSVGGKNFSAEFAELEDATKQISTGSYFHKFIDDDDLYTIAKIKPTAAVVEAWKELESAMLSRVSSKEFVTMGGRKQLSAYQIIEKLMQEELITRSDRKILNELRTIRNKAAHSVDSDVSVEQAERYIEISLFFANKLQLH